MYDRNCDAGAEMMDEEAYAMTKPDVACYKDITAWSKVYLLAHIMLLVN